MKKFTVLFSGLFIILILFLDIPVMASASVNGSKGTLTDIDGNVYTTVVIGEQEWMAENLRVTHFQNGDPIPDGTGISGQVMSAYYFMYDDNPEYVSEYGLLYNGCTINDGRGVCPAGWTVPTESQMIVMEMQLGMSWKQGHLSGFPGGHGQNEGGKLKETGHEHWELPNVGATDEYGFTFLPGGLRNCDGFFQGLRKFGLLLNSTINGGNIKARKYENHHPKTSNFSTYISSAGSIRCIRIQENQVIPEVITGDATDITPTTARIEGTLVSEGNSEVVAYGFTYSVLWDTFFSYNVEGTNSFIGEFVDLKPGTTYSVRAYAVNAAGISYGEKVSFTTPDAEVAELTYTLIEETSQTSILVSSGIIDEGGSSISSRGFAYAEHMNPTVNDNYILTGEGSGEFSGLIDGLEPNKRYFIRSFATNKQGTSYSHFSSVITATDKPLPQVEILGVEQITSNGAVVRVSVTDDGGAEILKCGVKVTSETGSFETTGEGEGNEYFVMLTNLEANSMYNIQAFAANENGMTYGDDHVTFLTAFENTQQAQAAMDRIYQSMYIYDHEIGNHDNFGVKSFDLTSDLMGEDMVVHSKGNMWFNAEYSYSAHINKKSSLVEYTWLSYYKMINMVNYIIANIEEASGTSTEKDIIKAQAFALRAFAHFQMVQVFSDPYSFNPDGKGIPYVTEYPNLMDFKILDRRTVREVYENLQTDLQQALELFEDKGIQTDRSNIDLAVAHGLRARVALAMNDWEVAAHHAELAINAAQEGGKRLFNSTEYTAEAFNSVNAVEWMWGSEVTDHIIISFFSHIDASNYGFAELGTQKKITSDLYNHFPDTDVRRNLFIIPGTGSDPLVDYNQMKFIRKDNNLYVSNYLLMRLSEMYLILAEANAKTGEDADALQSLIEVVSRRNPQYEPSSTSGQELIDEIMLQRRLELWGEGHRFSDIRRLQLPLNRPSGEGNHADSVALHIPANDSLFLWKIPFYSYLHIEVKGFGNVEVENLVYDNENPPFVADNSSILLKAIPDEGYYFLNWQKDDEIISTEPEFTLTTEDQDINLIANFTDNLNAPEINLSNVKVFPNPVGNYLNIQADCRINRITLYRITGQVVFSKQVLQNNSRLNVENLDQGVYFIKIETDKGTTSKKVVIYGQD